MSDVQLLKLKHVYDERGTLTVLEHSPFLPMSIQGSFWNTEAYGGRFPNGFTHPTHSELLILLSGSADIRVKALNGKLQTYYLNSPSVGIYIPASIRREVYQKSADVSFLHLWDAPFNPIDCVV